MAIDPLAAQVRIAVIMAAGFNASDAARWVQEADAVLPQGADPRLWLPDPGAFVMAARLDEASVQDARADWYVNAPLEWKLLLDDLNGQAPEVGLGEAVFYNPSQPRDDNGRWTNYRSPAMKPWLQRGSLGEITARSNERARAMEAAFPGVKFSPHPPNSMSSAGTPLDPAPNWPGKGEPKAIFDQRTAVAAPEYAATVRDAIWKWGNVMGVQGVDGFSGYTSYNAVKIDTGLTYAQVFGGVKALYEWNPYGIRFTVDRLGKSVLVAVKPAAFADLGEAILFNPNHYPAGSPRGGQFAPGKRLEITNQGIAYAGGDSSPRFVDDPKPTTEWIELNVSIEGADSISRSIVRDTILASGIPQRHLAGARFRLDAPPDSEITASGSFVETNDRSLFRQTFGGYVAPDGTIYIAPAYINSAHIITHEVGHLVELRHAKDWDKIEPVVQRALDRFKGYRLNLGEHGLRSYSLTNKLELYADAFVVAIHGSAAQQQRLAGQLDMEWDGFTWETLFVDADLFDPAQPRVPAGSPAGGQFAPVGAAAVLSQVKLSHHAFVRMQERHKYRSVSETLKRLAGMRTPDEDWYITMRRGEKLDGYLVGTDGIVKTVLGAWYDPGKLHGQEVLLAEEQTSTFGLRKSIEWQLDNLTDAIVAAFCTIAGMPRMSVAEFVSAWKLEWHDYTPDGLQCLLIARSEVEDAAPEDADLFDPGQPRVPAGQPNGGQWAKGFTFAPATEPVWTGKQHAASAALTKLQTGALGEAVAAHALREYLGIEFTSLNTGVNNAPVDMSGDHLAVEVKTGLASNGPSAQHWRATIGQPGAEEAALIKRMTAEQKREYNERKAQAIMERKYALLDAMSQRAGEPISPVTVGVILSGDGKRADVWAIPDFHLRIGWAKLAQDYADYFVGTWEVRSG